MSVTSVQVWPEAMANTPLQQSHAIIVQARNGTATSSANTSPTLRFKPPSLLLLLQARNKTFDVCYEYQPEQGLQLYELVASIPSSSGNYLATALATLQKNT
jgi:hypothetical protein